MRKTITRREVLTGGGAAALAISTGVVSARPAASGPNVAEEPRRVACTFSLNTATLRGMKLPLDRLIDIAAGAEYDAIEPWVEEIRRYQEAGGDLKDIKKRIADHGLTVVDAIGFSRWLVDDPQKRSEGLESMRRDMDLVHQIGGTRIAAPPAGATAAPMPLSVVATRYAELLKIGASIGVQPQLELWGFSKTLSRIGELAYVAAECARPDAGLLPDVFHIYKGGSDFVGLQYLNGKMVHVFHMNDYPRQPERSQAKDADRVFPGDGVAPLVNILTWLFYAGFNGALSIELFNREYWKGDPVIVAAQGLQTMKRAVQACTTRNQ